MLALALGKTRRELLLQVDTEELTLWMAFHQLSPIDTSRQDILTALVCTVLANCNRAKGRAFKISDFLIQWCPPSAAEKQEKLKAWFIAKAKPRQEG